MKRKSLRVPSLVRSFVMLAPILTLALPVAARASEQIVLPYDCRVVGGRVEARPASDQAYRIYGDREQKMFRACSRQNPDRCRSFMVQRFTLACGNGRVSWPEFYAAISEVTGGHAFLEGGQLYYRVGQRWRARDNYGFDDPFEERRGGTGIVEMPRGFAPLAGTEAIFTPLDPRVAALEETGEAQHADPGAPPARGEITPPAPVPAKKPAPPAPLEMAAEPVPPAQSAASAPQPPAAVSPTPAPQAATVPPANPAASPGTSTATPPVAPTILNNPAAEKVREAASAQQGGNETVVAASEMPAAPSATDPAATSVKGWEGSGGSRGLSLPPLYFAIAIAAATLIALLMILRRQAAVAMGASPEARMPREPMLPGFDAPAGGAPGQALIVHENAAAPAATGTNAAADGMPATRADALAVLGLSPGASEAAIRKVVEALRQSWHPDAAASEADRASREERLKRINVAADILTRRPAA